MLQSLQDIFIVIFRVSTIFPLLLVVTLFMGKRTIGELPVFDFLIIISLASVVGADIADPDIKHLPTAIAIVAIGALQKVISHWKLSNRKFGKLITFEPTVVVQNGKLLRHQIKDIGFSIDNILQMLREKDVFDISEVETAIIEANGALSVLKKPQKNTVLAEDLHIMKQSSIAFPVIIEGEIYEEPLANVGLTRSWLIQTLHNQGINRQEDVFFASINHKHELQISLKNERKINIPFVRH
ncbi:hypothetical protein J416_01594 [Gracilibacillus halophilus YIM-C55.5]|uniref:YetF C-terminal domain-containing protein n=1 Tax=Gracilibacillus halophilus YIM-C55.5 TaxID=1308866 RepID=N4WFV8_9BACI|nr:DUF421 domain-containing protein [Gracilibacillus halophilus]ENH98149.1 hypothetical protein J416_01594 [Gracilibacillus halophilus YIM-C55.5]